MGVPLNRTDPNLEPIQVREIVARYCRMDFAGARINPGDWPKLAPVVAWKTNPDFTLFMVTSLFDVDPTLDAGHAKYTVTAHYRLLGKYDLLEGYSEEDAGRIETVQFTVSEVNGEWRITGAEPNYPHLSKAAALQWINRKLAATQDPVAKTQYQHAVELLQSQSASPFAR